MPKCGSTRTGSSRHEPTSMLAMTRVRPTSWPETSRRGRLPGQVIAGFSVCGVRAHCAANRPRAGEQRVSHRSCHLVRDERSVSTRSCRRRMPSMPKPGQVRNVNHGTASVRRVLLHRYATANAATAVAAPPAISGERGPALSASQPSSAAPSGHPPRAHQKYTPITRD